MNIFHSFLVGGIDKRSFQHWFVGHASDVEQRKSSNGFIYQYNAKINCFYYIVFVCIFICFYPTRFTSSVLSLEKKYIGYGPWYPWIAVVNFFVASQQQKFMNLAFLGCNFPLDEGGSLWCDLPSRHVNIGSTLKTHQT